MPTCPATDTIYSSGYYDVGTVDSGAAPPLSTCDGGCSRVYTGGNAQFRGLVAGVYHYYALGSYSADSTVNSGSCTSGAASPSSTASIPKQTCATGQSYVTDSSGKLICLDSGTGAATNPNSTAAVSAVSATTTADAAAAGSAAATAASTAATAAGADAATAAAAGVTAAAAAAGAVAADAAVEPCKNDTTVGCLEVGENVVSDTVNLGVKNITVSSISPVSVGTAGVCPAPAAMTIHGQTYYFSYTTYCNFATGIKPIMLAFAWLLAAGILVGSIRS